MQKKDRRLRTRRGDSQNAIKRRFIAGEGSIWMDVGTAITSTAFRTGAGGRGVDSEWKKESRASARRAVPNASSAKGKTTHPIPLGDGGFLVAVAACTSGSHLGLRRTRMPEELAESESPRASENLARQLAMEKKTTTEEEESICPEYMARPKTRAVLDRGSCLRVALREQLCRAQNSVPKRIKNRHPCMVGVGLPNTKQLSVLGEGHATLTE